MMNFSERMGIKPIRDTLQIDSIDEPLKNQLWNLILNSLIYPLKEEHVQAANKTCAYMWTEYFKGKEDETPAFNSIYHNFPDELKRRYFSEFEWYQVYEFLEFIAPICESLTAGAFTKSCNIILKENLSGYRLVNNQFLRTTSEEEIQAIETATTNSHMNSVDQHLHTSLSFLSNREKPDYRNSIKESISAVEALCRNITGKSKFSDALKEIEKNYKLHKALKKAFESLYGYTSDFGGIRHSLLEDEVPVTFEDAKFMLVSCSAFINYLIEKIDIE